MDMKGTLYTVEQLTSDEIEVTSSSQKNIGDGKCDREVNDDDSRCVCPTHQSFPIQREYFVLPKNSKKAFSADSPVQKT